MAERDPKEVDFGYQKVTWDEKPEKVAAVFRSVAPRYDVMNDFMSLGIHRAWKHYAIQNRVFIGQKVTIYDRQDSWARVTDFKYSPRWIHAPLLSANKPIVGSGFVLPVELRRSDLSALASKPVSNLNGHDVIALRRFAAHALDTGKCSKIEDGDESLNRPGQLYIWCENYRKLYSPKSQWIPD